MDISRTEKANDFTIMCNHHLHNTALSLKAKGLLSLLLSLPDGRQYTTQELSAMCREDSTEVRETLNELECAGYIRRKKYGEDGQDREDVFTVYDRPPETKRTGG